MVENSRLARHQRDKPVADFRDLDAGKPVCDLFACIGEKRFQQVDEIVFAIVVAAGVDPGQHDFQMAFLFQLFGDGNDFVQRQERSLPRA